MSSNFIFRTIRWSAWESAEAGMEHVDVSPADGGIDFAGVVIGRKDETKFALAYRLRVDSEWRLREARLKTTSGHRLHLESNGKGTWHVNGAERADLQGCIDIDIEASPLTNTLPIRRLGLQAGDSSEVRLCYVTVPELSVSLAHQRYTALGERAYRFQSLTSGFTADLPVDEDGFVLDYPGLFKRLP
ncbi:putative glycolipid-binding domain-containing protein [Microvirga flavescens]|uniref:putative glycolipid-binding domain-containing protein n=1 Tax=Microvirga flavescens TaxID=2249811 RepID=UPI000DD6C17D|nr:putative glycolipid-binding domain-containing protein [Microvirga flavescens]